MVKIKKIIKLFSVLFFLGFILLSIVLLIGTATLFNLSKANHEIKEKCDYSDNNFTYRMVETCIQNIENEDINFDDVKQVDGFVAPTTGIVTAVAWYYPINFGGGWHPGIDIGNNMGTNIYAVADGIVLYSGIAGSFWIKMRMKIIRNCRCSSLNEIQDLIIKYFV